MVQSGSTGPDPAKQDPGSGRRDVLVALFLGEFAALLIALLMPVTPSKTGSTWSPAMLFWPDPSYLQEVAVYLVMTNLLIGAFLFTVWVVSTRRRSGPR